MMAGENTAWFEVSILPVVLSFLYWGAKADSWKKLLSFSFIISALALSYLDIMVRFRFNGTRGLDANPEYDVFDLFGILFFAIFFLGNFRNNQTSVLWGQGINKRNSARIFLKTVEKTSKPVLTNEVSFFKNLCLLPFAFCLLLFGASANAFADACAGGEILQLAGYSASDDDCTAISFTRNFYGFFSRFRH